PKVTAAAGSRPCLSHAIFTPGYPGWMDEVDRAIATLKPDSWKGYTVGDNTNKDLSTHPWRMDDEKLLYPFYEKIVKPATTSSASTRASIRRRRRSAGRTSRRTPTSMTLARRPRTGRTSAS